MSTAHDGPVLTAETAAAYRHHVQEAAAFLREQTERRPSLALVLGTGLGSRPSDLIVEEEWALGDIPHFPTSDDEEGTLGVGRLAEIPVLLLDDSLSLHEGYTPQQVAFPIRTLGEFGIETLLFANTAGTVTDEMEPSDLALVTDHINFQGANPLVGPNVAEWGPRFPDMSEPYDPDLRQAAETVALREGIKLQKGIYFAVLGPNLGTQAEYRAVRTLGANMVGTGSVLEVIAARHMDLRVLTLTVITDRCTPGAIEVLSSDKLTEAAEAAHSPLHRLLAGLVSSLGDDQGTT